MTITVPGTYDGGGRAIKSIWINASNVVVENWDVSNQNNTYGIQVSGGDNVTVQGNTIHDLCREGVYVNDGASHVRVLNNVVTHASMAGIRMGGTNGEVGFNEISQTTQYPRQLGGLFSTCTDRSGADADGIRYFGSGHTIHDNYMHDISNDWGQPDNLNPHTDCFQTWGPATNITISNNICRWVAPGENIDREFCEHEGLNGTTTSNLHFDHNLFVNGRDGCQFEPGVTNVTLDHNTFVGVLHEAASIKTANSGGIITNNISYDSGAPPAGGSDANWCAPAGTTVLNNDRYNPTGVYGTYCSSYGDAFRLDPRFVSVPPGRFTGYTAGDYHLQPTSPVPSLGAYPLQ